MPWARMIVGATASSIGATGTFRHFSTSHPASVPKATAPQMPRPPAAMLNACQGFPPSPKYFGQSVSTW